MLRYDRATIQPRQGGSIMQFISVSVRRSHDLSTVASEMVRSNISEVFHEHDVEIDGETISVETDCLAMVCLGCSSIAMAASPEQRDLTVTNFDMTCHPNQTYVFLSPPQV
jgi:hypothetical protein